MTRRAYLNVQRACAATLMGGCVVSLVWGVTR